MSSVIETTGVEGASAALARTLGDAEWLARLRADAAATAGRLSLPDSRRERRSIAANGACAGTRHWKPVECSSQTR